MATFSGVPGARLNRGRARERSVDPHGHPPRLGTIDPIRRGIPRAGNERLPSTDTREHGTSSRQCGLPEQSRSDERRAHDTGTEGDMTGTTLTSGPAWKALQGHYADIGGRHLRDLFAEDPGRGERLTVEAVGIYLDYSKNRITEDTVRLLLDLARETDVAAKRDRMFRGEHINVSEDRAVLHVALRMPRETSLVVDGVDVVREVHAVLDAMTAFTERVRSGEWKGHTGKPIRNVVNVGIGGSDLGPVMAYEALRHYTRRDMTFRFVSNVDSTDFVEATADLAAEETLFIISSKTFGTLETLTNATSARQWVVDQLGPSPRSPNTSWPCPPTPSAWPCSASTPRTCSASGTGSAAAIRWTPPSGSRPCWPWAPTSSARC